MCMTPYRNSTAHIKQSHNIKANPTAPPITPTTSQPQLLDLGARPALCRLPEGPVVVPGGEVAPADPVGVANPAPEMIVTAVMVDWLPSGNVVVCRMRLVWTPPAPPPAAEEPEPLSPAPALPVGVLPAGPPRVTTPPSMVVTTVTPAALTVVMTWPEVTKPMPGTLRPLPEMVTGIGLDGRAWVVPGAGVWPGLFAPAVVVGEPGPAVG